MPFSPLHEHNVEGANAIDNADLGNDKEDGGHLTKISILPMCKMKTNVTSSKDQHEDELIKSIRDESIHDANSPPDANASEHDPRLKNSKDE
ncbi:hypothetical protein L1887_07436 [Cichorium endivia]|nr:hypothetical protein L1887_07436 [Cichorium endivia]